MKVRYYSVIESYVPLIYSFFLLTREIDRQRETATSNSAWYIVIAPHLLIVINFNGIVSYDMPAKLWIAYLFSRQKT